jgi:murein DD-endopeptidase MepM/ murein hydrolase activator NlpD
LIDAEAAKLPSGLWNRDSTNPKSTAVGLTQFLKGTWSQMAKVPWTTLHEVASARRITDAGALLDLRRDPALSIMSAAEYAGSNLKFVMNKNLSYPAFYDPRTSDGKMRLAYLCHHEGPGGACTYLRGGKAQSYVEFLDSYIGKKIVPSRFRHDPARVPIPGVGDAPSSGGVAGSGTARSGPAQIPTDVISVPPGNPVIFAELQDAEDQWHWPLITGETRAMTVSYRTGSNTVVGKPSREFLANRQGGRRYHVGMDIFCHQGDIVLAVADGEIVNFYPFYEGTNALFVKHGGVVINYGEVAPHSDDEFRWKKNDRVRAGQPIARVGRLNMIHLETYRPGTTQNARWMQDGSRAPSSLLNPTKLLLGLAARGTRKL